MPTKFLTGDLFKAQGLTALAHGCNCAGAMGKGIAMEFRSRFPEMYAEYKELCSRGRFNPGDVFMWTKNDCTVFNLATQRTWRAKADLGAIEVALREMVRLAEEAHIDRVGLPKIGAGLGGLSWEHVRQVLIEIGNETTVELVVFETFEPSTA